MIQRLIGGRFFFPGFRANTILLFLAQPTKQTVFNYWRVMYAKPSSRKNKIWEDDGTMAIEGGQFIVRATNGKELAKKTGVTEDIVRDLAEGQVFIVGGKEVQLLEGLTDAEYESKSYLD